MVKTPVGGTKKPKRISMQAIAKRAGVSTTTVSLALRDHSSITDETKRRIVEIQHLLGYQFTGRRSKANQPYRPNLEQIVYRTIGVDMREENYAPFLAGIVAECRNRAIKLELDSLPVSESSEMDAISSGTVPKRGVIISGRITERDVEEAEQSGLPYLVLGNYYLSRPTQMVGINLFDAAERAMQDLVRDGMKRVVVFVEVPDRPYEREFLRCMRGILFDLGIPMDKIVVVEGGLNFSHMEKATALILKELKSGSRIVTLEKHCAETLALSLRGQSGYTLGDREISAFVTSPPRFPNAGFRAFDLGAELCGRLAVTRLTELQRSPDQPINSSYIYSPGWMA